MRFFKAFYLIHDEDDVDTRSPKVVHQQFDDKVFALPYRRTGYWDDAQEAFAVSLIAKDGTLGEAAAQDYLKRAMGFWGLDGLEQTRFEESTVEDCFMESYVHQFSSCCFDESNVRRQLNLTSAYSFISSSRNGMKEVVLEKGLSSEKAKELMEDTCYGQDFENELERIYVSAKVFSVSKSGGSKSGALQFAPITYIVENDTPSDAEEAIQILVGAMMEVGRIDSGHIFTLDVDDHLRWPNRDCDSSFRTYVNHQLIRVIEGNSLVLRYGMLDGPRHYDVRAYQLLTMILDLVESVSCNTQLFLSIPEGNPDLVLRLRRRHGKPMVRLGIDGGIALDACTFDRHLQRMEELADSQGIVPDDSMGALLSKRMRMNRSKGRPTDLEDVFEEWRTYHDARLMFPQYADVIDEAINLDGDDLEASAQTRMDDLVGLTSVKEHIHNVILRVQMNRRLMESGLPQNPFSMHMAFLGAPGTGKTEVARLYAEILKDEGVLSEGRLITVSGGSGFNVKNAFEAARGSVLFVDEAYGMLGFDNMIAEFIAQMENNRADTVVILAGYEGHMNALLSSNPGFRSRIGFTIEFPDYSCEELQRIFAFMCEQHEIIMGDGVAESVRDITERGGRRTDQGNARFVRKLFEDAVGAQQVRLAKWMKENATVSLDKEALSTLTVEDMEAAMADLGAKESERSGREELDGLIGLGAVKELVNARMDMAKMQKVKRDAGLEAGFIPMHMAFMGNPGTGKTEVARLIGRILREEGVLSVGGFFECGKQDLVSPVAGGSAAQIAALFQEARGSVIFIDEAYTLLDGGGAEAVTALIDQMEKMRDEVVVIFAGYADEIRALLDANPGFASRVRTRLSFPDYTVDELVEILHHMAEAQGYRLEDGVDARVRGFAVAAKSEKRFGNGRFVRNLLEDALVQQSVRLVHADSYTTKDLTLLQPGDFTWKASETAPVIGFVA